MRVRISAMLCCCADCQSDNDNYKPLLRNSHAVVQWLHAGTAKRLRLPETISWSTIQYW